MKETLTLNTQEQKRVMVLNRILAGHLSTAEAAVLLKLSHRQVQRILAAYRKEGAAAVVHGNRGRKPKHRIGDEVRQQVIALAREPYEGCNQQHLRDLLAEREGIVLSRASVHRILQEAQLLPEPKRRQPQHRRRRKRYAQEGMLVQIDGSRHAWLGERGPWLTLIAAIDDATGLVTGAVFRLQEDAAGYFGALIQTAQRYGLPLGVYSDRHGIFWRGKGIPSLAEQFSGERSRTQVGTALELAGIAWIAARSPQAKGRIERLWGTAQDRLISELRLARATTIEQANVVLAAYLARHNRRFGVAPANPEPAWRPLPAGRSAETIFCFRHVRHVANDGTFSIAGRELMIAGSTSPAWKGHRIEIQERLDGVLWAHLDDAFWPVVPAPPRPLALRRPRGAPHKPPPDHPWRRYSPFRPRCQSR